MNLVHLTETRQIHLELGAEAMAFLVDREEALRLVCSERNDQNNVIYSAVR